MVRVATLDRRRFLQIGAALSAGGALSKVWGKPTFNTYPFTLGVASGYPLPNGVVLWTRLAPEPFAPGGGTDIVGRIICAKLTEMHGQSFIVDNRASITCDYICI